jgi:hypothetical protein
MNKNTSIHNPDTAVIDEKTKQYRINELKREIRELRLVQEQFLRKRQKMSSRGKVPKRPSVNMARKWYKLHDELYQLQGKKAPKKRMPGKARKAKEKGRDTAVETSNSTGSVVKPKKAKAKKRGVTFAQTTTAQEVQPLNTFDPSRTLEVWEKPQVARRGKYQQPGEHL